jgi:threonine dehydrogenase-like Zn-dependent dehydrogenase
MRAVAVSPGKPHSAHLIETIRPDIESIPNGRGVLVKVLHVGVDGTDREINEALYGAPPPGDDFLILGHENFGRVEAVGPNVTRLKPGDYVVATVRRPGRSIYDQIGLYDFTTDEAYYERGINLLHGYLAEYYVDDMEHIIPVPPSLKEVGVLLEPSTVMQKGWTQATEIQHRLKVWRPQRAAVLGAGTIGLLATLILRLRGLEVTTFARKKKPTLNADLAEAVGARYLSTQEFSLRDAARRYGPFDLILEATGHSPMAFEAMDPLGKNGVLILSSVTGGRGRSEIPADQINLGFVLGNKVAVGTVSANREHFKTGVRDLAFAEAAYRGWLKRLLTHPVKGLEQSERLFQLLDEEKEAIKIYCEVSGTESA